MSTAKIIKEPVSVSLQASSLKTSGNERLEKTLIKQFEKIVTDIFKIAPNSSVVIEVPLSKKGFIVSNVHCSDQFGGLSWYMMGEPQAQSFKIFVENLDLHERECRIAYFHLFDV